jgi:hypothetical protein
MTKEYKLWVYVEEIDEEKDLYEDIGEPHSCGTFETLEGAEAARLKLEALGDEIASGAAPVLSEAAYTRLVDAVATLGSYKIEDVLPYIEEKLTFEEHDIISAFLHWVFEDVKNRGFSSRNIVSRIEEFRKDMES